MPLGIVKTKFRLLAGGVVAAIAAAMALFLVLVMIVVSLVAGNTATSQASSCLPLGASDEVPVVSAQTQADQLANAKLIDQAASKLGLSGRASRIAIITAYGEATLINLDHGDAGQGVTNADGSPTTSFGLFQQQVSQGWGTKAQVMNPIYAATSFFTGPKHDGKGGLVSIAGWDKMEPTDAIHAVQRNADSQHYARFYKAADAIIKLAGIDIGRDGKTSLGGTAPSGAAAAADGGCGGDASTVTAKNAKDDYPFKNRTPPPGEYVTDPFGYYYGECTSFVAWRINRDAGSTKAPFKYSSAHGNFANGNGADWKAAWEKRGWKISHKPVAGAVAWWGANGGPGIGSAGHVAYVQSVTKDGKAIIEEYNNSGYAPPGHKYSVRPQPVAPDDVNAFLYPPPGSSKAAAADSQANYDKAA